MLIPFPRRPWAPSSDPRAAPSGPPDPRASLDVLADRMNLALGEAVEPDPADQRAVLVRIAALTIARIEALDRADRDAPSGAAPA